MYKYLTILITLIFSVLVCSGQPFLSKYPKLKKKNLPEFFEDWKAYSDSVAGTVNCHSDVCNAVNAEFDSWFHFIRVLQGDLSHYVAKPKRKDYGVIPQFIPVEYYPIEIAPADTLFFSWVYAFACDYTSLYNDIILVNDTITPALRTNELYLTTNISDCLLEFITGQNVKNERPAKFIQKNIKELRKYIDHYNEEHYGMVDFSNYPYVWKVQAFKNFIILHIITSNYTGYEQWYINYGDGFRKVPGKKNAWIE
ncbi:MAG: hypothetical protein K2I89_00100 [Muribaculaceae bacterium]|nr:hypothetical protein [Muribaculaceae bacterium]